MVRFLYLWENISYIVLFDHLQQVELCHVLSFSEPPKDFQVPLTSDRNWPADVIRFFVKGPQCPPVQAEDEVPGLVPDPRKTTGPPCGTKCRALACNTKSGHLFYETWID